MGCSRAACPGTYADLTAIRRNLGFEPPPLIIDIPLWAENYKGYIVHIS
jgi:hypothetical protein